MGMTIWIHTLEDRNYSRDSDDHSTLCRHLDAIDNACQTLGVRALGEFMDYTEQEYGFDDFEEEEPTEDPETGLAYGIDDMAWFDGKEGLSSFKALRDSVFSSGIPGLKPDEITWLIEELDNCIAILEATTLRNGQFHLTLVE